VKLTSICRRLPIAPAFLCVAAPILCSSTTLASNRPANTSDAEFVASLQGFATGTRT
jgi:hypothetical protein